MNLNKTTYYDLILDQAKPTKEDSAVFYGKDINTHKKLLFYKKVWPGKGDFELDWIVFKSIHSDICIVYKSSYNSYGESIGLANKINVRKIVVPRTAIADLNKTQLVVFLSQHLFGQASPSTIYEDSVVDYQSFIKWLKKLK